MPLSVDYPERCCAPCPPLRSPRQRNHLLARGVLLRVPGRVPRMVGRFLVLLGRRLGTVDHQPPGGRLVAVDRPVAVTVAAGLRVAVVVAGRRMSILARC